MKRKRNKPSGALAATAAGKISSLYGYRTPADSSIEDLAMAMGILVVDARLDSSVARLVRKGKNGLVRVSDNVGSRARRKFAIAHEIGHFVMHEKVNQLLACTNDDLLVGYKSSPFEIEASIFAGALLMPKQSFREMAGGRAPKTRVISELSSQFETTLTSTAIRYVETSSDYCVFVVSEKGKIRWWRASKAFQKEDFWLDAGDPIPRQSAAAKCFRNGMNSTDVVEVNRSSWFPENHFINSSFVLEQAIPLPNYSQVISLIWLP